MICSMLWYIVVQIFIGKSVPYFVPCFVPCYGTLWYKYTLVKKSVPYFVPCFVPYCGTLWYKYTFVNVGQIGEVGHIVVKIYHFKLHTTVCK